MTIFSCQWRNNRRHGKLNNKFVTHEIRDYTTNLSRDSYFRPTIQARMRLMFLQGYKL